MKNNHNDRDDGNGSPSPGDVPPYEANVYAAIVELIQNGEKDQALWEAVYYACHARAARWIRADWPKLRDHADDVFQIACWNAMRALSRGEVVRNPVAWFDTMLRNAAAKYSGRLAKYRDHFHLATDMNPEADCKLEPEARPTMHVYEDERQKLREAIGTLTDDERNVIELCSFESFDNKQLAIRFDRTIQAAKNLRCRALNHLREKMTGDEND